MSPDDTNDLEFAIADNSQLEIPKNISEIDQYGFRYREIASTLTTEQQLSNIYSITYNAIFLLLEGELQVSWGEDTEVSLRANEIFFLPRAANVRACIKSDSIKYVVVRLRHNFENSKAFNLLNKIKDREDFGEYHFRPMQMNQQLIRFSESVRDYIQRGVRNTKLDDMKLTELQIILRWFYTPLECTHLFYPIVGFCSEFEEFILNNYRVAISIDELASMANMSRSTFDRKFKESFNTTPLKWIDEQTRQAIIHKSSEPNVTVKSMMYEVCVYNSSQFTKLCKRLCGVTPSELIRQTLSAQ